MTEPSERNKEAVSPAIFPSPFPTEVAFRCATEESSANFQLHPEEEEAVGKNAVEVRRQHFRMGRAAAHQAIMDLTGRPGGPIEVGARREPIWPGELVGTITHSGDVACAAVAFRSFAIGVGYDIEVARERIDLSISRFVCRESETAWVHAPNSDKQRDWRMRAIFCAKESIFKAFFPIDRVELDFQDVELQWDDANSTFECRLLRSASRLHPADFSFRVSCKLIGNYMTSSVLLRNSSNLT